MPWPDRAAAKPFAEEADEGHEHERLQNAAGHHDAGDLRADDVAHAQQGGVRLQGRRGALEPIQRPAGHFFPQPQAGVEKLIDERHPESDENGLGGRAARLADNQHVGAGGAFGVNQLAVLFDDERPAKRDHHQNAQQPAQHRNDQHPRDFHIESENHHGGHGHADAEGDRLAGRAGGLDDVVLQNARLANAEDAGKARNSVIDSTATGIEAETVMPTFSTR